MIVPVTGQAVMAIPEEERDRLADQLAGSTEDEARRILGADSRIAAFDLAYEPDWLPHRLPRDAGRIDVVVE
jgi:hypothetical protein